MVLAVATLLWQLREHELASASQTIDKLGIAVAEQTTRSIQAADIIVGELRTQMEARGFTSVEAFKAGLGSQDASIDLARRFRNLPQVDALALVAADGKLVNFSHAWPVPPTDLSDRDYMAHFAATDRREALVSYPVRSRGGGAWTTYVVRRINGPGGQFIGVAMAAIRLDYFHDFFDALTRGTNTNVVMLRRDGTVLASNFDQLEAGAHMPAGALWFQAVAEGRTRLDVDGMLLPGRRIVSVHPLAAYPVVIDVGVNEWDALTLWRRVAALAAIGTASATICVLLLLRVLSKQLRRLEQSKTSLADQNARLECNGRDIERQAAELAASQVTLGEQSSALQLTLGHMNQGIMMVASDGAILFCNDRAMQLLDLPRSLFDGKPTFSAIVAYQRAHAEFPGNVYNPAGVGDAEIQLKPHCYERTRPNGTVLEIQSIPLPGGGMVRTYSDITARRTSEAGIRYLAHHDGLTHLVNRNVFNERLDNVVGHASRHGRSLAVLYIDLDGFKSINDTHGHLMGDKLLIEIASRLRGVVRETDTVARMGGDEFAIIQPNVDGQSDSERLAERILAAMGPPYTWDDVECRIGLSIGIALYPHHAETAEHLLRMADLALYRAKAGGKNAFKVFEHSMDLRRKLRTEAEQELVHALEARQFFLEYQPIVDAHTLEIIGFEALLRWRHPMRGMIGPADFIPMAEAAGIIVPIGQWVLETACAEAVTWPPGIHLAVNLSPVQFSRGELASQVAAVLARTTLDPSRLTLEVTEGVMLEQTEAVLGAMAELRRTGVRFSLDDFGTAHAGLTYLRSFRFDVLKVDKSFVQDAVENAEARAIVAAILAIGAAFHLTVTAEGVETEAQLVLMQQMGCPMVQGYLTGRPTADPSRNVRRLTQAAE